MATLQGVLTSDPFVAATGRLSQYPQVTQSDAQYAVIDHAASGANTIVSAVSGKKIRVLGFFLVAAGAVNVRWESEGSVMSGVMNLGATDLFAGADFNPTGWFETPAGRLLGIDLSDAVSVDGALVYVLV